MDITRLFNEYSDLLYNYARSRLSDPEEIEDVIQDTFLVAIQSWEKYRGDSSPSTWIIGILKNKIYEIYRKKYKNSRVISESEIKLNAFDDSGFWINNQPDSRKSIYENLENSLIWDTLLYCIDTLPNQHRILYKMREFEQMNSSEICKKLDISTSNLHVLLHRIRIQLKICMEGKGISNV
ncbi:MAG: sigma-70 family RNA polymerase sigma factor [Leptospiraceae bacterium]|nr:sigma-70 family RNA polymerase sigma factor [Leptospiraceae bacterium]